MKNDGHKILFIALCVFLTLIVIFPPQTFAAKKKKEQPPLPSGWQMDSNIVYRTVNKVDLKLDMAWTPEGAPHPCVIWIHGGGWKMGEKQMGERAVMANDANIAFAGIDYRLSTTDKYPAQIEDCLEAVRFVRKNAAKYNIDPTRLAVWGSSAGGHLSMLVGVKNEKDAEVKAVVSWFGPHDLNDEGTGNQEAPAGLMGVKPNENPDLWKDAKCSTHVTKNTPPVLMIHGDSDSTVPLSQSEKMRDVLTAAGIPNKLIVVKGAEHMFKGDNISPSKGEIDKMSIDFLKEHLLPEIKGNNR